MGRCMVEYDDTLQILASAGDCRTDVALSPEGIEHLIDLAQRMSSVVVVDVPHVWSDWVRHVLVAADEVVLTAVPDFASLRDAKTALDTLGQTRKGATPPKLVLNKVDVSKKAQLTGKDFQTTLGATIMLTIPYDPQLFSEAANTGQMIGETAKSHKTAQALAGFAASIAGKTPASRKTATAGLGGLLQWLRK